MTAATVERPDAATTDPEVRPVRRLIRVDIPGKRGRQHLAWEISDTDVETRQEREARYLSDDTLIDTKDFAFLMGRARATIKDMNYEANALRDAYKRAIAERDDLLAELASQNNNEAAREYDQLVEHIAGLEEKLVDALVEPVSGIPVWRVRDAMHWGRATKRLNEWYEKQILLPPGRRPGTGRTHSP